MKPMNRLAVKDILKKRENRLRKSYEETLNRSVEENAADISVLLEKLISVDVPNAQQIDVTDEEKAMIIMKIEEKEGLSLNQETVSENMVVWRGPIGGDTALPDTSIQVDSYGSSNKVFNNYFVLQGKLEVCEKSRAQPKPNKRSNSFAQVGE